MNVRSGIDVRSVAKDFDFLGGNGRLGRDQQPERDEVKHEHAMHHVRSAATSDCTRVRLKVEIATPMPRKRTPSTRPERARRRNGAMPSSLAATPITVPAIAKPSTSGKANVRQATPMNEAEWKAFFTEYNSELLCLCPERRI